MIVMTSLQYNYLCFNSAFCSSINSVSWANNSISFGVFSPTYRVDGGTERAVEAEVIIL